MEEINNDVKNWKQEIVEQKGPEMSFSLKNGQNEINRMN